MKAYLTSDTHFNHSNIMGKEGFCPKRRGVFSTVDEMNNTIIENINKQCNRDDVLYHLGDIGLGKPQVIFDLLERIKPRLVIVGGNHDSQSKLFKFIERNNYKVNGGKDWRYTLHSTGMRLKYEKKVYYLTHFPMGLGDQREGMRNFCGHIHEESAFGANVLNIGVDSPEIPDRPFGTPISFEEAVNLVEIKWATHPVNREKIAIKYLDDWIKDIYAEECLDGYQSYDIGQALLDVKEILEGEDFR